MAAQHQLHKTSDRPPAWIYRGVVILGIEGASLVRIPKNPEGMPGEWTGLGNIELAQKIIDAWLDTGALPGA